MYIKPLFNLFLFEWNVQFHGAMISSISSLILFEYISVKDVDYINSVKNEEEITKIYFKEIRNRSAAISRET